MPISITAGRPTLCIRRDAYERANLARQALDERLGLTADEFRVEEQLVALGPIYDDEALGAVIAELEAAGLAYFDDFVELSGNWPEWLHVLAMTR